MSARACARRLGSCTLLSLVMLGAATRARAQPPDEPPRFVSPPARAAVPARESAPLRLTERDAGTTPERRLIWRWHRFNELDYASTALIGGAFFYVELRTKTPAEPRWTGGVSIDDDVREVVVGSSREIRNTTGRVSDWFTLVPQIHMVVDSTAVPLADRWNVDVAWQMMAINLQAQAVTGLLTRAGHHFIARERPDVGECRDDVEYDELCFRGSNASFPSGHTSGAFAGAALGCVHHAYLPLYGGGAADAIPCAVDLTMATTSGVLRMVADRHYLSDVVVGAAIGVGAGLGIPLLLHYREPQRAQRRRAEPRATARYEVRWTLAPLPHPEAPGLGVYGWF